MCIRDSGAIAGVMGAYFVMFHGARVMTLIPLGVFTQLVAIPAPFFLGKDVAGLDRVIDNDEVSTATVDPAAHGLARATTDDLRGGDAAHNADVVRRLLEGEPGPVRDAVLLNAGAALAVYDAPGTAVDEALDAGLARAREAVDSGSAKATLDRWVAASSA